MSEDNLPADRMVLIEGVNPVDSILINVDDLETVKYYDSRPLFYTTDGPHPYGRGLSLTFKHGNTHLVETKMTLREFEIERAKKFTPVAVPAQEIVVTHSEDGWKTESVKTVWEYYNGQTDHWYVAQDLTDCLKQAEAQRGLYRAVMDRRISKEYRLDGE